MPFGITGFGAQQTYPAPQIFQALSLSGAPPVPPAPPYGTPNEDLVPVARTGNPVFPANLTVVAHLTYQAVLNVSAQTGPLKPSNAAKAPVVVPTANQIATSQIQEPSSQTLLTHLRPEVDAVPNTTNAVNAANPSVAGQVQGPSASGLPARIDLPEGLVSFQVLAAPSSITSGVDALNKTIDQLEAAERAIEQAPANPNAASANAGGAGNTNPGSAASSTGTAGGGTPGASSNPPAPAPVPVSTVSTPAPASPGLVARIVQTVQSLAIGAVYSSPVFSFSA
ncbi:MAG TPA: hypothetical protein VK760_12710 [Candidatus Acidoferrales bacterium]|nr:hypothetical protein [Candidatus Acidoferrales bacterium]